MKKKVSFNLYTVLLVVILKNDICASQLFGRKLSGTGQLASVYPNNNFIKPSCPAAGSLVNLPKFKELKEYKTCYKEIAETRKNPKKHKGRRTIPAILELGFYLKTYYNVTTPDGYILTVFRITGNAQHPPRKNKPAVLMQHAIITSTDGWFFISLNRTLVSTLVNAGYEVWLPNARGTDYSQGHVRYDANYDIKYWDFGMHEPAIYDFPTVLNLVLTETGNEKVYYIGFSISVNMYTIALAEMPELNEKIEASIWLGTTTFFGHSANLVRLMAYLLDVGPWSQELAYRILRGRLTFGNDIRNPLLHRFCSTTAETCGFCGHIFFAFFGYDATQVEYAEIADITSYALNTISFKTIVHAGENLRTCRFQKFNYGPWKNYKMYGQYYPPLYNLSNLRAPVYMWYGESDNMAPPLDQMLIRDALPPGTVKGFYRIDWKQWNHLDFLMAKDADILLYNNIVDVLNSHEKKKHASL